MKKQKYLLPAVLAMAAAATFSTSASAQAPEVRYSPTPGLEFSVGKYEETYKEKDQNGGPLMQEVAKMTSVKLTHTVPINQAWSQRVGLEYAFGDSTYTGSYWGGQYGDLVEGDISRWRFESDLTMVFSHPDLKGLSLTGGLGYRVLRDNLQETVGGYERQNKLFYATVGAEHRINLDNGWAFTPSVQYKHLLKGTQESSIAKDLSQKKGNGYDVNLRLEKTNSYGYGFAATAYLRTWDVKDSEMAPYSGGGYIYEPANTTKEVGVRLSYMF